MLGTTQKTVVIVFFIRKGFASPGDRVRMDYTIGVPSGRQPDLTADGKAAF
jgi:hypothetical protein